MKVVAVGGTRPVVGLLGRLANKIDPTPEQLASVRKPAPPELKATLLKQARDIDGLRNKVNTEDGPRVAEPVPNSTITVHGERMCFFDDGSLRHAGVVIKGKAARKKFKKERHRLHGRTEGNRGR